DPSVEHSRLIILASHAERSHVVDRGNEWAWTPPEQTPIARNVKHIELMLTREPGQGRLMPKNILYGRPKSFRHGHDLHARRREAKQGQVLLQHKQFKLMPVGMGKERAEQSEKILGYSRPATLDDGSGNADLHAHAPHSAPFKRASCRTFFTAGCAPVKFTRNPWLSARLRARSMRLSPLLSINRTRERSMTTCPEAGLPEICASVNRQTCSALAAVISPCQSSRAEALKWAPTTAACSRIRASTNSQAEAASGAVAKNCSMRSSLSVRVTARLGASNTKCRPAARKLRFNRISQAMPALSIDRTASNRSRHGRSSLINCSGDNSGSRATIKLTHSPKVI